MCQEHSINEKSLQQAEKIVESLTKMASRLKLEIKSSNDDIESILRCLTTG